MNEVKELRRQGYKVRINHYRYYNKHNGPVNRHTADLLRLGGEFKEILPHGGITRVEVDIPGEDTLVGEAVCSLSDNYNKRLGIKIALGRALKGYRNV